MMGCSRTKQCTTAAPTQSYCTPVCTVTLICKQPSCSAPDRIPASNPQQQMFLHYVSMLSQHSYSISLCSLFQYFDYSFQFLETQMLSGANSDIRWRPLHCVGSRPSPTRSSYPVPPLPHSPPIPTSSNGEGNTISYQCQFVTALLDKRCLVLLMA